MPIGGGKYDDECTYVREKTDADAVLLFVMGGDRGQGFSVQADMETMLALPDILESMAAQIRKDMLGGTA